jgi:methionyl aminopeptidase
MHKLSLKTQSEIEAMKVAGSKLAYVRDQTARHIKVGVTSLELDRLATKLIKETGSKPSFSMISGYRHSTCININDEVVHSIPSNRKIRLGDVVSLDVGLCFNGWHSDTSVTVAVGKTSPEIRNFLKVGIKSVKSAIAKAKVGNRVWDLSHAMQKTIEDAGYGVVTALTGHGIGRFLHEEPAVPCFEAQDYKHSPILKQGMVLAIEIMYAQGSGEVVYKNDDGWTICTRDGKIAGLFEETVAVTKDGPLILTR